MLHAQATGKDNLRKIETRFNVHGNTWYHLGINSVARSSLADANKRRDYQIFEKLFYTLLSKCKEVVSNGQEFSFKNNLYSFDSSTIALCLSVFDWAKYRTTKGALKLHMLLNNRTAIPELINVTESRVADISVLKQIDLKILEKGSIITFDRAYIDYELWKEMDNNDLVFVSRTKKNQNILVVRQHNNQKMDKGILADEIVMFRNG